MLIAIVGCDGSGKTTQAQRLQAMLNSMEYPTYLLDNWSILDKRSFSASNFIKATREEVATCISEMVSPSRVLFLFWMVSVTLSQTVRDRSAKSIFILDGYWIKYAAAELEYGVSPDIIRSLASAFPTPDMTLFLDVDVRTALQRKTGLNAYECGLGSASRNGFTEHQKKLRKRLQGWAREYGWNTISTSTLSIEAVAKAVGEQVLAAVARLVPSSDE